MQIGDSIALVTGANRGLGLAFTRELARRGAARVYGAARQLAPASVPDRHDVATYRLLPGQIHIVPMRRSTWDPGYPMRLRSRAGRRPDPAGDRVPP